MNFKFVRNEESFSWESEYIKLEFSKFSSHARDEYGTIEDMNDCLFLYYTVSIYKKEISYYNEELEKSCKWKLVAERDVFDFPCIEQLRSMLQYVLSVSNPKDNGEKMDYGNGMIKYRKTYDTVGFACEDFYEITHILYEEDKSSEYIVYMGCSFDSQGDKNSVGIRTPYVSKEDLRQLLECLNACFSYVIKSHNERVINNNKIYIESLTSKENKLYLYNNNEKKVNKEKYEEIFTEKDSIDFKTVKDIAGSLYSTNYSGILNKIEKDIITVGGKEFSIKEICYISKDIKNDSPMLNYKQEDIVKDFLGILNKEELLEFRTKDILSLYDKYGASIVNRTWMYRSEHKFPELKKDRKENMKEIVLQIISDIKKKI